MPHECTNCGRTFPDGSKEMLSGCPDCGGNKFQFSPARTASSDSSTSNGPHTGDEAGDSPGAVDSPGVGETSPGGPPTERPDGSSVSQQDNGVTGGSERLDHDDSASSQSVREWVSKKADENERRVDTSDFAAWPDSARRPEDRSSANDDTDPADRTTRATMADDEGSAQSDARTDVVSTDGLPTGTVEGTPQSDGTDDARTDDARAADSQGVSATDGDAVAASEDDRPPEHGRVVSEPTGDRPSIDELRAELNEQFESIKIVRPGEYELNLMELYNREEYIVSLQEDGRYVIDVPDSWRESDG
ncbi:OapC/ArvC family zinc-ribbon domain-containing protein [Natrarchaeobaculum sulfurireducens]|uniref:OapC/ArvC family zinc-ribbon domain-containing protein n=1 Tax=Natrarchaeobaculum sulfurireducens TaxID=2044521 RepID=UPI000E3C8F0D|nr:Zn-ribbon containing protein [Natrarchaeobaculum sulfurireducens]